MVEAAVATGHREAGHQPLHVPLERSRQGLVEVVDAEDQPPVRRGEHAEVRQVRVTAELHVEPGAGRAGEVGGHRVGRAAEERERRDQHAAVADRHQLRDARRGLLLQQLDRVAPVGRRRPFAVAGARRLPSRRLAELGAFLGGQVLYCGDIRHESRSLSGPCEDGHVTSKRNRTKCAIVRIG